jgi:hypothetical protein
MEIVVLTNLLAPFTGPYLGEYLLGAAALFAYSNQLAENAANG